MDKVGVLGKEIVVGFGCNFCCMLFVVVRLMNDLEKELVVFMIGELNFEDI